jgi:uncharacterized protein (DUF433 family)
MRAEEEYMAIATAPTIKTFESELLVGDLIQPGHPLFGIVWINRERMSGTPCFYGTRVPVQNLFDYLKGGEPVGDFLEGFPGVEPEQVLCLLEMAQHALLAQLPKA